MMSYARLPLDPSSLVAQPLRIARIIKKLEELTSAPTGFFTSKPF